mgnify:FL=1
MNRHMKLYVALTAVLIFTSQTAWAGIIDPDCTAEKAAKSTATKAVVGVGGRCSPAEAAKDTAKDATGIDKDRKDDKDKNKDKGKEKEKDKGKAKDKKDGKDTDDG